MSGKFNPIPLPQLLRISLNEINKNRFHGIPGLLFFHPGKYDPFRMSRYGRLLETPIGVAAGPHSQLAGNIIAAWLCGARYIELKTVQTLDELEVSKPCIDMQDEGYNCEWSQELKLEASFREYLNAWIIIHILRKELGFEMPVGTLFNMSVGYNLDGILKDNVQWFLEKMRNCSAELEKARTIVRPVYPAIDEIEIPTSISDHVTLSTMHGCPPEEIEKIGLYLIRKQNLHTTVKFNPTLLGAGELRSLLNGGLGFSSQVPDQAFEHDLKYTDAHRILDSLGSASSDQGLTFSVKLTNTLESINNKDVFASSEKMMYLSGRALHPISIQLARKLQNDLLGQLDISFSAGVDCFNVADVIACGLKPATVCSDLLKPGGYGRLHQYLDILRDEINLVKASNLDEFIINRSRSPVSFDRQNLTQENSFGVDIADNIDYEESVKLAALKNLNNYANRVSSNSAYHKDHFSEPSIKTSRQLGWFDCIHAPCTDTCPTNQDIPVYMYHTASGNVSAAFEAILRTNPFPSVTGMVCDHLCQMKCTRINYDDALRIREIKRFVAEGSCPSPPTPLPAGEGRIAVIGAGPAGLTCAWFLRKAGFEVHVFEQKEIPGGMVSAAIPAFRLTSGAIETDVRRILDSGVKLHDNYPVDKQKFDVLRSEFDAVFIAVGAQRSSRLNIDGINSEGVLDPLQFLFDVRKGNIHFSGKQVVIIGGGNTAMDAARTAYRMVGESGRVTIVYRRTIREMPADNGEIKAVMEEGVALYEQTRPVRIRQENNMVVALVCCKTALSVKGKDGRVLPIDLPDSEFEIPCDTIIPAIGQEIAFDFLAPGDLKVSPGSYLTSIPNLYIGGDALRGASTAINAIGDGRKAAEEISPPPPTPFPEGEGRRICSSGWGNLMVKKATRSFGFSPAETSINQRRNFNLVMSSLTAEQARNEASRCLQCDVICNVCVSVCPNLANFSFQVEPVTYQMQKAVLLENGSVGFINDDIFRVEQPYQVMNIRDLCNECGNCSTFCPTAGRPFADKPGLCLSIQSFNEEATGFFLSRLSDRLVLIYKEQNHIRTLSLVENNYIYETDQVKALIRKDDFSLIEVKFLTPCVREFHFTFAAEMSVILKGAMEME
ncbi:MAG: FAD-dependent oxidoreductase [Bacteroidetes bacterium]|nr:FAD-dependent oxidoreductase [Bacteroidota bacterium]